MRRRRTTCFWVLLGNVLGSLCLISQPGRVAFPALPVSVRYTNQFNLHAWLSLSSNHISYATNFPNFLSQNISSESQNHFSYIGDCNRFHGWKFATFLSVVFLACDLRCTYFKEARNSFFALVVGLFDTGFLFPPLCYAIIETLMKFVLSNFRCFSPSYFLSCRFTESVQFSAYSGLVIFYKSLSSAFSLSSIFRTVL